MTAVKHTTSGLLKLLYPHEDFDKEAVRECLEYALQVRRRVKEQLKRIGGMEFFDVHFSYIDLETSEEKFIMVKEQGGDTLIPEGQLSPGSLFTVAAGSAGLLGLYRLETQMTAGNGKIKLSGLGTNAGAKEAVKVGFEYFRANATQIQASAKPGNHEFHLHVVESHNTGPSSMITLASYVALCSALLGKPIEPQMVVLGSMSLGGSIIPVENLAATLQVAADAGANASCSPWQAWPTSPRSQASCSPSSKPASTPTPRTPSSKRSVFNDRGGNPRFHWLAANVTRVDCGSGD